jgi:hypothetical protein
MMNRFMPKVMLAILLVGALWVCSGCTSLSTNPKVAGEIVHMEWDEDGYNYYAAGGGVVEVYKPEAYWIKTRNGQGTHQFVMRDALQVQAWHVKKEQFDAGQTVYWP